MLRAALLLRKKIFRVIFDETLLLAISCFEIAHAISYYLQGEGFNARFFTTFSFQNILLAWDAFPLISLSAIIFLSLITLSIYACTVSYRFKKRDSVILVLSLAIFIFLNYPVKSYVQKVYENSREMTSRIDARSMAALGLNPRAVPAKLEKAHPGKNIILIYLESIESTFTDPLLFPHLTPNINRLKDAGISFHQFGQTPGTGCTVSGIFSSQCGTPFLLPSMMSANDTLSKGYFQNAACFGDILAEAGYHQVYMGGASSRFAGKGDFLTSHGYGEVYGFEELAPQLEDPDYITGWGLYDDTLFDLAAREYIRLAEAKKPFNLTLLTIDTHPDGFASRSCTSYTEIDNRMLNAVHCTDQLLGRFIQTISTHPAYKETIVAILTDHLMMGTSVTKYFPADYDRRLLFILLNTGKTYQARMPMTHMDVAPTLLSAMEVSYDSEFLCGKNQLIESEPGPAIDETDPNRLAAIKYINKRYFSQRSTESVPGNDLILDFIDAGRFKMGNEILNLSYNGSPLSVHDFLSNFVMLVQMNNAGTPVDFNILHTNDLIPFFLQPKKPTEDFILIFSNEIPLPFNLNGLAPKTGKGLTAVFGELGGPLVVIGHSSRLNGLRIDGDVIALTKASYHRSKKGLWINPVEWLMDQYRINCKKRSSLALLDRNSKFIRIPCIKTGLALFQAELKQRDPQTYELVEVNAIAAVDENICCAYFGFGQLFLPLAVADGSIELQKLTVLEKRTPVLFQHETIGR